MKRALTIRSAAVAALLICLAVTPPTRVGACVCSGADSSPCVEASAAAAVFVADDRRSVISQPFEGQGHVTIDLTLPY